jgi:glycosyltransferase involved in cell wall biosynthesis
LPYAAVDPSKLRAEPFPEREEIVVVHAPTDRVIKGTQHVIEAVDMLRGEGVPIRLDLVEGVSREVALERLARADLLVDQLVLGWYGTVAVEAMALGRPVMAYIREDAPEDNPFGADLPVVRTTPATLVDDLRALAADRERRRRLSIAGRSFVERHHDPVALARKALDGLVALPAA